MSAINPSMNQSINPYNRKLLIVTGTTVGALLITAFTYWYQSSQHAAKRSAKKRSKPVDKANDQHQEAPHGFLNIGNTCFLNCIVQSLMSLDCFIDYLVDLRDYMRASGMSPSTNQIINHQYSHLTSSYDPVALIDEMIAVLKGENKQIVPLYKHLISQSMEQFRNRDQHDAHELFVTWLDLLQVRANQAFNQALSQSNVAHGLDILIAMNEHEQSNKQTVTLDTIDELSNELKNQANSESVDLSADHSTESVNGVHRSIDQSSPSLSRRESLKQSLEHIKLSTEASMQHSSLSITPPSPLESHSPQFKFPVVTNGAESPCAPYLSSFNQPIDPTVHHSLSQSINRFPPLDPFTGLTANSLTCLTCQYTSPIRHTPFNTLSVSLPYDPAFRPVALEHCLRAYCRADSINDVNCALCSAVETEALVHKNINESNAELMQARKNESNSKAKAAIGKIVKRLKILTSQSEQVRSNIEALKRGVDVDTLPSMDSSAVPRVKAKRTMLKQVMLARCPALLCIHVNRLIGLDKMRTPVLFNEQLDLLPMTAHPADFYRSTNRNRSLPISDDRPGQTYRLMSVVVHLGQSGSGHFTAYRRHKDESWHYFSDETVSPASWETVRRSEAYMLFYRKIS